MAKNSCPESPTTENSPSAGNLYIVATPIGNLKDITLRAIEVLKSAFLVAAEDTRRAAILFCAHGINRPVTSLFEFNEKRKTAALLALLAEGRDIALITDAGTPGISDPGYFLIREAVAAGIRVVPIPGVSAVIAALSASGIPGGSFIFDGFLPASAAGKKKYFLQMIEERRPLILYDSPRRLPDSLKILSEVLGNREIVVARELTKAFEEIRRGQALEIREHYLRTPPKGEITLIIGPAPAPPKGQAVPEEELERLLAETEATDGLSLKDRAEKISRRLGLPRKRVYQALLAQKDSGK